MTITAGPSGTITRRQRRSSTFSSRRAGRDDPSASSPARASRGGFVACYKSNAQPYTGLANGSYTFSVARRRVPRPDADDADVHGRRARHRRSPAGRPGRPTTPRRRSRSPAPAARSSFQCRFDSAAFAACTSPFTPATALAEGAHTFEVRALTPPAAPDPTPASRVFTVDTTAPDTTITGGPTGTSASTSATFTFTLDREPASTFQCSLDGAAFGACPASYTGLAQGSHTFQVRATDAAGNATPRPPRAPGPSTPSRPTRRSPAARAATRLDAADVHLHLHRARRDVPVRARRRRLRACPASYTGLSPGLAHVPGPRHRRRRQHRRVARLPHLDRRHGRARTRPCHAHRRNALLATPTVALTGTAEPNRAWTPRGSDRCAARHVSGTWTVTLIGGHRTGRTRTGPRPTPPATRCGDARTVIRRHRRAGHDDRRRPDRSRPTTPRRRSRSRSDEPARRSSAARRRRVRDAARRRSRPPRSPTAPHTFEVRAIDAAGNVDDTPATRAFTVDTTPPPAPDVAPAREGATTNASPRVRFNAADATHGECRLDGPDGRRRRSARARRRRRSARWSRATTCSSCARPTRPATRRRRSGRSRSPCRSRPRRRRPPPRPRRPRRRRAPGRRRRASASSRSSGTVLVKLPGLEGFVAARPVA